ncbi:acetyl-CoA carboxylase [Synchytrium microbalum]|uniref:Acetyl-CoA carboxylase n=1 Tax=Synchytrium microbalum TaxID=1806994 RepID=A0A507BJA2_9FUNG|nr:acetyl-CoA carboxylase [Synchytrium microbalum]TPX30097.1 acetyl-CoA carboxylase [Synchytrium microbalum]
MVWDAFKDIEIKATNERFYSVLTDVPNWPQWDVDLEKSFLKDPSAPAKEGAPGHLKMKNGREFDFNLGRLDPTGYTCYITKLPGASAEWYWDYSKRNGDVATVRMGVKFTGFATFIYKALLAKEVAVAFDNCVPELKKADVDELDHRRKLASQFLETDPGVIRQREQGKLTPRERIALLIDPNTALREFGSVAGKGHYTNNKLVDFTRANFVTGRATVISRNVVVGADDFTVRGGHADGAIWRKQLYGEQMAREYRIPVIRLIDGSSGGGSVTTILKNGSSPLPHQVNFPTMINLLQDAPVAAAVLGPAVGMGAARATLTHFTVVCRGLGQLFAAGPPVVYSAWHVRLSKEELGGADVHIPNGTFDNEAISELECMNQIRQWLSYMPQNTSHLPPRAPPPVAIPSQESLLTAIPKKQTRSYDPRTAYLSTILDPNSFFEIGRGWGQEISTGWGRIDGFVVGIIASDPRHGAGAMTHISSRKLSRFVQIADLFNIPIVSFVDQPGFAIGLKAESEATIRFGSGAAASVYLTQLPWFTVIVRKAFGVAGGVMVSRGDANAQGGGLHDRVAWPSGSWGSLPLEGGIEAAYKRELTEAGPNADKRRKELLAQFDEVLSPYRSAEQFDIEEIISPVDTRQYLVDWVRIMYENRLPQRLAPGFRKLGYFPF